MILSPAELDKARQILAQYSMLYVSSHVPDRARHNEQFERDAPRFLGKGAGIISIYDDVKWAVYNSDAEGSSVLVNINDLKIIFKDFINRNTSLNISAKDDDSLHNICFYMLIAEGLVFPMGVAVEMAMHRQYSLGNVRTIVGVSPIYVQINYEAAKGVVGIKMQRRLPLAMEGSDKMYWAQIAYYFNPEDLVGIPYCSAADLTIVTQRAGFEGYQPGAWVVSEEATALFYTELTVTPDSIMYTYAPGIVDFLRALSSASVGLLRGPSCMERLIAILHYLIKDRHFAKDIAKYRHTGEKTIIQTLFSDDVPRLLTFCNQAHDASQLNTFFMYWSEVLLALPDEDFSAVVKFLMAETPWRHLGSFSDPEGGAAAFVALISELRKRVVSASYPLVIDPASPVEPEIHAFLTRDLTLESLEECLEELMRHLEAKPRQILAKSLRLHVSAQDIDSHNKQIKIDAHRILALDSSIISFCKDDEVLDIYNPESCDVYKPGVDVNNTEEVWSRKLFDAFHDAFKVFINRHTPLKISEGDNDSLLYICLYLLNQQGLQYPMAIVDLVLGHTHYPFGKEQGPMYVQVNYDTAKGIVDIKMWRRLPLVIDDANLAAPEAERLDEPHGSMVSNQTKYWVRVGYCFNLSDLVGMPFCSAADLAIDTQQAGFEGYQPGAWVESQEATALLYTTLAADPDFIKRTYAEAIIDCLKLLSSASVNPLRAPSYMAWLITIVRYVIGHRNLTKEIARHMSIHTGGKTIIQTLFSENIDRLMTFCHQASALQLKTFFMYWSRVLLALPVDNFSDVLEFLLTQTPWLKLGLPSLPNKPNKYRHPDPEAAKAFFTLIREFKKRAPSDTSPIMVGPILSPVNLEMQAVIRGELTLNNIAIVLENLSVMQRLALPLEQAVPEQAVPAQAVPEQAESAAEYALEGNFLVRSFIVLFAQSAASPCSLNIAESSAASCSGAHLETSRASSSAVQRTEADGRAPAPGVAGSMRAAVQAAAARFWSEGEASASGVDPSDEDKAAAAVSQQRPS